MRCSDVLSHLLNHFQVRVQACVAPEQLGPRLLFGAPPHQHHNVLDKVREQLVAGQTPASVDLRRAKRVAKDGASTTLETEKELEAVSVYKK